MAPFFEKKKTHTKKEETAVSRLMFVFCWVDILQIHCCNQNQNRVNLWPLCLKTCLLKKNETRSRPPWNSNFVRIVLWSLSSVGPRQRCRATSTSTSISCNKTGRSHSKNASNHDDVKPNWGYSARNNLCLDIMKPSEIL